TTSPWTEHPRTPGPAMSRFEYAPAPESRAIVDLQPAYGLFINGAFVDPTDGGVIKSVNPASEEVLAEVAEAGAGDVDRAVRAARAAYEQDWGRMPGRERAKYLFRIALIVGEGARERAGLELLDNVKPSREYRGVARRLVEEQLFNYAGWTDKLEQGGFGQDPRPIDVDGQVI